MAQAVGQGLLALLPALLQQLGQQHGEGVAERQQQAPHQRLLALRRALAAHDQHARRLEHEELVVAGEQRREAVLLRGQDKVTPGRRRGGGGRATPTGGASSSRSWMRVRMSSMKAFMCLLGDKQKQARGGALRGAGQAGRAAPPVAAAGRDSLQALDKSGEEVGHSAADLGAAVPQSSLVQEGHLAGKASSHTQQTRLQQEGRGQPLTRTAGTCCGSTVKNLS